MAEKTNFHPYYIGTEHGRLSFGQLRKKKTEISACMLENGRDAGRHYFTMDSTGDKEKGSKGSTKLFCPGTLTVKTGKDIVNYDKGATLPKEPSIPGIVCMAENGDILIKAPQGRIKLEAVDIELKAAGFDGKAGNIILDANEKITLNSNIVDINATVSTKIFSNKTVEIIGKGILNIYAGLADFADSTTVGKPSKISRDDSVVSSNEQRNEPT
tara:strand:+ start:4470 stop:5111 length:642 start_codon:yes stop_codon:yes gene_type:complete